ncbi:DUF6449 domain-containing protein [Niallia sp. 03133]|uniref:DUF6449 domain-containing protein n=1 Tax=Niallia sp. 03133 TaxID=3458060 RepID=UPI004044C7EF
MRLNRFFYHKQLSLLIFRSVGWVSILSFLVVFFSVPLQLMLMNKHIEENTYYFDMYQHLFKINISFQMAVIILLPILLAIFLFRFTQHKAYSDLMHSLPLSRKFLFHYYCISGLVLLVLPIVLNGIILRIMYPFFHLERFFAVNEIYYWTAVFCIFSILLFVSCVFIGMLTGLSIIQGVFTCLFLLFPTCIFFLICYNFNVWIYGFPFNDLLTDKAALLSPILVPVIIENTEVSRSHYVIYFVCAICFYFFAFILYQKRKAEAISQALAFSKLKGLFKYTFTVSCLLIGSLYGDVADIGKSAGIIGSILGAVIGYLVAEMILRKTWRVFFTLKKLPIFIASISLLIVIMIPIVKVYEKYTPSIDSIQSVSLSDYYIAENEEKDRMMDSQVNINHVLTLHKELIARKNQQPNKKGASIIRIKYKLKNGRNIYRNYKVNREDYENKLKPIYESQEFKALNTKIFSIRSDEVNDILLRSGYKNDFVRLANIQEIKEFISALQKDRLAETYESMTSSFANATTIEITLKGQKEEPYAIQLSPTYSESRKWLKDKGLLQKSILTYDDIKEIKIAKTSALKIADRYDYNLNDIEKTMQELDDTVLVNDKQMQQNILDLSVHDWKKYAVVISYKYVQQVDISFISEHDLPESLKTKLDKN